MTVVELLTHLRSTSGISTEPSACWQFSRRASRARVTATAVPFRVWTKRVPLCPGLR